MKMIVFWNERRCSLVETDRSFTPTYFPQSSWRQMSPFANGSLISLTMEAVSTSETSVNFYPITRVQHPRRNLMDVYGLKTGTRARNFEHGNE
jgi:hypothetical protein